MAKSGLIVEGFTKFGYNIEPSNGKDFFECVPRDVHDGVITNPPYSIKDKFIRHCYDLGKPFALFLPVASFQGAGRGKMFMEYGMSCTSFTIIALTLLVVAHHHLETPGLYMVFYHRIQSIGLIIHLQQIQEKQKNNNHLNSIFLFE